MATKAFQKIYTQVTKVTKKATCLKRNKDVGYDELATIHDQSWHRWYAFTKMR